MKSMKRSELASKLRDSAEAKKSAKNRVAELEAALAEKAREVKVLEGRVAGYQEALLDKRAKDERAKFYECAECGAVWTEDQAPRHRLGCSGWVKYMDDLQRRAGYDIVARKRKVRPSDGGA